MEHIDTQPQGIETKSFETIRSQVGYAVAKNITYGFKLEEGTLTSLEAEGKEYPITTVTSAMRAIAGLYVKQATETYNNTLH